MQEVSSFDHLEKPANLRELHQSLVSNLNVIEAKSSKTVDVSFENQNEIIVRAKVASLSRKKLDIVVMPDILLFRKEAPSKTLAIDLKYFSHSVKNEKGYCEIRLVRKDAEDELRFHSETSTKTPAEALYAASRVLKTATKPIKTVFVTRALNAIAHLTEHSGEAVLQAVAAAPSDFSVLVRALEQAETTEQVRKDEPLLMARLRGIQAKQQLVKAEGGALSVEEVAKILSMSRQAVDKRRRSGQLIAVNIGRRGYAYPAWQFGENGTIQGLETVLQSLRGHDEWMQLAFMLNANIRLNGRRPLDELRQGRVEAVREAAKAYGEQGAA
jgi:hypothetical protein